MDKVEVIILCSITAIWFLLTVIVGLLFRKIPNVAMYGSLALFVIFAIAMIFILAFYHDEQHTTYLDLGKSVSLGHSTDGIPIQSKTITNSPFSILKIVDYRERDGLVGTPNNDSDSDDFWQLVPIASNIPATIKGNVSLNLEKQGSRWTSEFKMIYTFHLTKRTSFFIGPPSDPKNPPALFFGWSSTDDTSKGIEDQTKFYKNYFSDHNDGITDFTLNKEQTFSSYGRMNGGPFGNLYPVVYIKNAPTNDPSQFVEIRLKSVYLWFYSLGISLSWIIKPNTFPFQTKPVTVFNIPIFSS